MAHFQALIVTNNRVKLIEITKFAVARLKLRKTLSTVINKRVCVIYSM